MSTLKTLDKIDAIILKELLKNPRTSFTKIAKKASIPTTTAIRRFNMLKKTGIIQGATLQINPSRLGYNCIASVLITSVINKETNVIKFLLKIPNVLVCVRYIGKYNVLCIMALKSVDELAYTLEPIKSHPNIINLEVNIWIDGVPNDHPENLIIEPSIKTANKKPNCENALPESIIPKIAQTRPKKKDFKKQIKLDKIDFNILRALSKDARVSFRKIALKNSISTQSAIRRYNRLRTDVISFSSITVNLKKLGYTTTVVFLVNVLDQEKLTDLISELNQIPNVISVIRMLGVFDLTVVILMRTFNELHAWNTKFKKIQNVKTYQLLLEEAHTKWPIDLFSKIFYIES